MPIREFTGELDAPSVRPFTGQLDQDGFSLNRLFGNQSVMADSDGMPAGRRNPAMEAIVNRIFQEQQAKLQPAVQASDVRFVDGPLGIAEAAARRGIGALGESLGGASRLFGDVTGMKMNGAQINEAARRFAERAQLRQGNVPGFGPDSIVHQLPEAAVNAGASILQTAPSLAANVVAPGSGLPLLFAQVGAQEYGQGRDAGLPAGTAALRAAPMAAAEIIGEKVGGFDKLTQGIRGSITDNSLEPLGRAMLQSAAREVPGEELTTTMQFLTDKAPGIGLRQDATLADYTKAVKDTALATLLQSGAMAGGGAALQSLARQESEPVPIADQPAVPPAPPADVSDLSSAISDTARIQSGNIVEMPADIELDSVGVNSPESEGSPATVEPNTGAALNQKTADPPTARRQPDIPDPQVGADHSEDILEMVPAPEVQEPASGPAIDGAEAAPEAALSQPPESAPSMPAPAMLSERSMQITEPVEGMRPGDIASASGKPFATQAQAAAAKREAGKGWAIKRSNGGFVVRHQPPTAKQVAASKRNARNQNSVDPERDSMFAAIAKLGGINRDAVRSEWGYDNELKNLRGAGIKRVATKNGMGIDGMAEALAELGYLSMDEHGKWDLHEFGDLFDGELGGSKHYTPEGFMQKVERDQQEAYEDYLSEQEIKDSGYDSLPEEAKDQIEGFIHEHPETEDELEARLEREGRELDERASREMVGDDEDPIPFSAKERNRGTGQIAARPQAEPNPAERPGDAAQSAEGFGLESHTRDDLQAREAAADRVAQDEARTERKRVADAQTDDFTLTGSDRPADVAASRGQQSLFSQSQKDQSGLSVEQVREAIADDTFGQEVDVYATLADAPAHVREQAKREGVTVEGFFDPKSGRVALIAENLDSAERARAVARHELIGHYGLEGMLGKEEMDRLAQRVIKAEQEGNKAIAEAAAHVDRTQPGLSPERRAREIIAVMAERNQQNSIVRRVMDAIRRFLRSIGIKQELTDAEISRLLRDTQAYLAEQGRSLVGGEQAAFSASAQTETPAFKKWFGDSRAVDDKGRPLPLYHGTQQDFDTFRPDREGALYLSSSPDEAALFASSVVGYNHFFTNGSNVMQAFASIENPLEVDLEGELFDPDTVSDFIKEAKDDGHDGIIIRNIQNFDGGDISDTYIVFNPAQIKSAMGNKGTFDPENSSILFSAAPQQDALDLKPEPIKARDFLSMEKDKTGRRRYVAGRKLHDRAAAKATEILGKVKLADNAPDSFKQIMRDFRVDQSKAQANAKKVAEIGMSSLNTEERKMLADIIEGYTQIGDMTPEAVVKITADIQSALAQQGEDLVELGMLSRDRLLDNYLPRAYRNPLLARLTNQDIFRSWYLKSRLRIRGARLKSRGMVHEIKPGEWPKYQRLGWKLASMPDGSDVPADLYEAMTKGNPIPPTYPNDLRFIVWRDYTMEEREKMGEIHDGLLRYALGYVETQRDIAIGRLFSAIAANKELASKTNPGGWAQVPDREIPGTGGVKQYGALSGMYVPDYVRDAIERSTQPKGPLMQVYDRALNFWKEGKTVWNPVAHGNNVASNVFTAHYAGINVADPRVWRTAAREYRNKGRFYQEAVDNGLFGTEWVANEVQDMFMPDLSGEIDIETVTASRMNKTVEALKKTGKPISWYRERMQALYQGEDQFFKLMLFIDRRKSGMSIEDAINDTERYIFNYADVPEGVQILKRTYSPFFSYTYKALPMLLHTAMHYPHRLLAPIALMGGANWLAYAMVGGDEDEERKHMPEYMKGRTAIGAQKSIRVPFNIENRPAFVDMTRRVPLGDLFDLNNQTGGMEVPAPFMPSHPLFTATAALMFNKDTFSGKDITKASDTDWEVAAKRADWMFKQIVPNAPFIPGTWNWDKLMNGTANAFETELAGYTGYTKAGDSIPLGFALLDVVGGTKIRSFDPERAKDFKGYEIDKERKEIQANIRSANRNQSMTAEKRQAYIQGQKEKINELTRKRKEEAL